MLRSARDYWARGDHINTVDAGSEPHGIPVAPPEDVERPSLLRRLASVGRGRRGVLDASPDHDRGLPPEDQVQATDEQTELPVFFGRSKGSQS